MHSLIFVNTANKLAIDVSSVCEGDHLCCATVFVGRATESTEVVGEEFQTTVDTTLTGRMSRIDDLFVSVAAEHGSNLNEKHLNVDPIFQSIEREGCSAAVINFMWFRGDSRHEVSAPFLINLLAGEGIPDTVAGPKYLALADFVPLKVAGCDEPFSANAGLMKRHGFHDEFTAKYLFHLLDSPEVPDFTLAYFPNNDFESHKQGPVSALSTVKEVDAVLAELIEQHGGLESFLQQFSIVITGDHSQSLTLDDPADRDIVLDELLPGFQQATPGKPWEDGEFQRTCGWTMHRLG